MPIGRQRGGQHPAPFLLFSDPFWALPGGMWSDFQALFARNPLVSSMLFNKYPWGCLELVSAVGSCRPTDPWQTVPLTLGRQCGLAVGRPARVMWELFSCMSKKARHRMKQKPTVHFWRNWMLMAWILLLCPDMCHRPIHRTQKREQESLVPSRSGQGHKSVQLGS